MKKTDQYFPANSIIVDTTTNDIFFYVFSSDDYIIAEHPERYRLATDDEIKFYEKNRTEKVRVIKLPEQEKQVPVARNYYKDLQQIEIGKAINQMVEIALPTFTKDKVLVVAIELDLNDFKGKRERREIKFVFDRKTAYTFVGAMEDDEYGISEKSVIEFLGYHDSCWREGAESKIRQVVQEMSDKYDGFKNMSAYTSFGVFGNGFVDGEIRIEHTSSDRKASFVKLEKINS